MKTVVETDEAVVHLRELLAMSKEELLRECKFTYRIYGDKIRKNDIVLYAFERKFNRYLKDPTIAMEAAKQNRDLFNANLSKEALKT